MYIEFIDIESLVKILFAGLLGASVGLERGTHGRPAGLRTHALVCMASALLIAVSRTGALEGIKSSGASSLMINMDPSRMAAGIVTGVGFLGAGAILRVGGDLIRGLTTAACIWFVAALGVAVGMGAYILAAVATVGALTILTLLNKLEGSLGSIAYRTLVLKTTSEQINAVEQKCKELISQHEIRIQQTSYAINNFDHSITATYYVRMKVKPVEREIVSSLSILPGVVEVQWH